MAAPKLVVKEFDGTSTDAESWLRRFKLIAEKLKWNTAADANTPYEARCQMGIHLTGMAGRWFDNLVKKDTYDHLIEAFKARFVTSDSRMVIEQQMSALKLQPDGDVETYHAELLRLGNRLDRNDEALSVNFLNGLPPDFKSYCLSTDTHKLETYKARAKLYQAIKKTEIISPIPSDEQYDEQTNAFNERPYNQSRGNFRGRGRGHQSYRGRGRGYNNYNNNWRGGGRHVAPRGQPRGRGQQQRGRGQGRGQKQTKQQYDNKQSKQKLCYGCLSPDHMKNQCPYGDSTVEACKNCGSKTHESRNCPFQ